MTPQELEAAADEYGLTGAERAAFLGVVAPKASAPKAPAPKAPPPTPISRMTAAAPARAVQAPPAAQAAPRTPVSRIAATAAPGPAVVAPAPAPVINVTVHAPPAPSGTLRPGEAEERRNDIARASAAKQAEVADYEAAHPQPVPPIRSYLRPPNPVPGPIRPPLGPVAAAVHMVDPRTTTPEKRLAAAEVRAPARPPMDMGESVVVGERPAASAPAWNMEADVASGAPQRPNGPVTTSFGTLDANGRSAYNYIKQITGSTDEELHETFLAPGAKGVDAMLATAALIRKSQ